MKKCFVITAYCNAKEKEDSLKDTIYRIKKYGYDILLHSHYAVSVEIQTLCNYVIYDYSNPIFSLKDGRRAIINWKKLDISYKLNSLIDDYGYAVVQQIKRGLLFAHKIGYDIGIVLNYDTKFSDEFFREAEDSLNEFDGFFLNFSNENESAHFLPFFLIKIDKFLNEINRISIDDYIRETEDLMAEGYIAKLICNNVKVKVRNEWEGLGKVWTDIIYTKDLFERNTIKCNLFLGLEKLWINNNIVDFDKFAILCYQIEDDFELTIKYEGENIYYSKIKKENKFIYSHLPIPFSQLDPNELEILIDSTSVYSEYKKNILYSSIEK